MIIFEIKDGFNQHQREEITKALGSADNPRLIMAGYNCHVKEYGGEVTVVEVSKN